MQQRDYLLRLIEQIAAMIASALGAARSGRVDDAERLLDEAWVSAVGMRRTDAERLDDATLRVMLGGKTELAARLFEARASLQDARGDAASAEALRRRAARLMPAAREKA